MAIEMGRIFKEVREEKMCDQLKGVPGDALSLPHLISFFRLLVYFNFTVL